jgi:hypothetical protein
MRLYEGNSSFLVLQIKVISKGFKGYSLVAALKTKWHMAKAKNKGLPSERSKTQKYPSTLESQRLLLNSFGG